MFFNPKVSVVIPVYNGSNYLREAIDSALAQSYENIEVIVINDGSNDGGQTEIIAKSYGSRIRYYCKENGGVATALNLGVSEANGEYISWLSHDDLYYPYKIERQVNYLRNQDDKNIVLFSDFDVVNYMSNTKYTVTLANDFQYTSYYMLKMLFASSLHGCSMLLPKSCFVQVGYFSETLKTTQDYEYWFKLLNNNFIFHHLSEPLILTRHHKEQGTQQLLNCHINELNDLYSWAIEMFFKDFKTFSESQLNEFVELMKGRGLTELQNKLLEIRDAIINIRKIENGTPVIWLYWENKIGKTTPTIIKYCHETIGRNNYTDFIIIKTNPHNIMYYLTDINKDYLLFEKIAHKADYLRFNLLYHYGGIWLDSDFIAFKSLKPVLDKINEFGFIYTGYVMDDGNIFPIIHFLGAKKHSPILLQLINKVHNTLEEKVKKGIQPAWDEIGGYSLQPLLNETNSYRYDTKVFSRIDIHGHGQREMFLPLKFDRNTPENLYGQMLCYSVHSDFYDIMGEDILKMKCYIADELNNNLSVKTKYNSYLYSEFKKVIPTRIKSVVRRFVGYFTDSEIGKV